MSRLETLRGLHILPVHIDESQRQKDDSPLGLSLEITADWEDRIREEILRVFQPSKASLFREILEDNGLIIFRHLLLTDEQRTIIPSETVVPDRKSLILPPRTSVRMKDARYLFIDSSQAPQVTKIKRGEKSYTHHWEEDQTLMALASKEPKNTSSKKSRRNTVIG